MKKDSLENVSESDIGRRLTLMLGEQPILTGIIRTVTDSYVSVDCKCTDNGGVVYNAEVKFERDSPNVIFSMEVMKG